MFLEQIPQRDIPFGERLTRAVINGVNTAANGVSSLALAPIVFCRHLFIYKEPIRIIPMPPGEGGDGDNGNGDDEDDHGGGPTLNLLMPDDKEEWKKEHDRQYGS